MESENMDFEKYLSNALKQYGYLFPETDAQMDVLEKSLENFPLPKEFENPEFVFDGEKRKHNPTIVPVGNSEYENNWAIAARDGKKISDDVWAQMNADKEKARKNQNENRAE
jgi:hypothetical protein